MRELGQPLCDFSTKAPYTQVQSTFDDEYPEGRRYYWKSLYLHRFDDEAIDATLKLTASRPLPLSTVDVWQLGGAMARVAPDATAFGKRDAPYLLGIEANWDDPAEDEIHRQWARDACASMERFSTRTSYLNFEPDPATLSQRDSDAPRMLLVELKRRYDPGNLFRVNHTIGHG